MNKWALILGASSGIGEKSAIELAKKGLNIYGVYLRKPASHIEPLIKKIESFGVSESYFIMECKLHDIIELGNKPASGNLILGEVIHFHVDEKILNKTNEIDPFKLDPIARNGGSWYTDTKKGLFELKKPKHLGIGFDKLPENILHSDLTGNELAKLASIEFIPEYTSDFNLSSKEGIISLMKDKIKCGDIDKAWQLVLYLGIFLNGK